MREILSVAAASHQRGTRLLILLLVASMRNAKGYSRPSVPLLVKLSGMSTQTVRERLSELCSSHDLAMVEKGGGKGKGSTFRVLTKGEVPEFINLPDDYAWKEEGPWGSPDVSMKEDPPY